MDLGLVETPRTKNNPCGSLLLGGRRVKAPGPIPDWPPIVMRWRRGVLERRSWFMYVKESGGGDRGVGIIVCFSG